MNKYTYITIRGRGRGTIDSISITARSPYHAIRKALRIFGRGRMPARAKLYDWEYSQIWAISTDPTA